MSVIKKIFKYVFNSEYRFLIRSNITGCPKMSDEEFISRKFKVLMDKPLDLNCPTTFNEKLQWIKLNDRNPEYTKMVDKYLVRDYIREKLGEEYLIPLLGVWDRPEEIDFDTLPEKFVLKCNHNSGVGMCICRDKSKLNRRKVLKELRKGLAQDYYLTGREWPYKNVSRKIIAEKFMVNGEETDLRDYKFQCFNGKIDHVFVCIGRNSEHGVQYYYFDEKWNYLEYTMNQNVNSTLLNSLKPDNFDDMCSLVKCLAASIPEIRVDLYEINGKIYFGELTFFTQSGFDTTISEKADTEIGKRFLLPTFFAE